MYRRVVPRPVASLCNTDVVAADVLPWVPLRRIVAATLETSAEIVETFIGLRCIYRGDDGMAYLV